jgi:hypothetical protein
MSSQLNSMICKCGHFKNEHGKDSDYCMYYCPCLKYTADNLKYLEKMYNSYSGESNSYDL